MKHDLCDNALMHVGLMHQFLRVGIPQLYSVTQVDGTTDNQTFVRMPIYAIHTINMSVECLAGDELFILALLFDIQDHTLFVSQPTHHLILSRTQTNVEDAIDSGFYFLPINVAMIELLQHLDEREHSFLICDQNIPAIIKTLDATHTRRQLVIVEFPIFQFINSYEIDVSPVSLLVVAQDNKIAVFEKVHMHQLFLWFFGHVLEAAEQVVGELGSVGFGAGCEE